MKAIINMGATIKKIWIIIYVLQVSISTYAYDFEVDGIYYNILSLDQRTCEVTYNPANECDSYLYFYEKRGTNGNYTRLTSSSYPSYKGDVTIPGTVNYKGRKLIVTGIGEYAFLNCRNLTSLSLPSSIRTIKEVCVDSKKECYAGAFDYCGIETFTIGNPYTLNMLSQSYAVGSGCKINDNLKKLILAHDLDWIAFLTKVDFSTFEKLTSIKSNSRYVPIFSDGKHFSNEQYLNTEVLVPEEAFQEYQSANIWKDFWELKEMKSVKSIILNETYLNLEPNQTFQLLSTVLPEDAFDSSVVWSSSNPSVATVDSEGLVSAITKGDAIITVEATDGSGVTAECQIHVDLLVKRSKYQKQNLV